jgi:DNA-binding beta-propeller fold protein YncE
VITVAGSRRVLSFIAAMAFLAAAGPAHAESLAFSHAGTVYADANGAPLRAPEGVACTDSGRFVVADTGNARLLMYTAKDGKIAGGTEIKLTQLQYPLRVQIDSKGNILAFDSKTRRIVKVDQNGGFGGNLDLQGAAGELKISAFKLDSSDGVIALDLAGRRVLIADPAGKVTREVPLPEGAVATDVAVDGSGTIYAIDPVGGTLWSAGRDAASFTALAKGLQELMSFGMYVTAWQGKIIVVDQNGSGLVLLGPDGAFLGRRLSIGWSDGLVNYPAQVCLQSTGLAFVADRFNNRVQLFNVEK